ncbi:hypothetical protein QTP70_007630 [Hemibagrus guttatus]|uniref:Reverse transcriptase n=1 Tax=Hemibagrus guttatus TaxID=175788 RepID=A0AAE0PVA8_9TELE|nr:hypothetical protein QTP70_007630 [Hemibagrus guttatus]
MIAPCRTMISRSSAGSMRGEVFCDGAPPEAEVAGSICRAGDRKHTVREVGDRQKVGNRKTTGQAKVSKGATSGAQTDINFYSSSVLDHINMCIDDITTVKHVKHFPNQKPRMNSEVCFLLKARDAAFKSGNAEDYSRARANLKRGIRKAKHAHKLRIKEHFHNNSDPRHMWKGIQTITEHKPSVQSLPTSNAFLPDELNHFFARFDKDDTTVVGRISNNDESAYREEIQSLSAWCSINKLTLNAMKTKGLILIFWKSNSSRHSPIYTNGSEVERVSSFKFLGVHISEDLSWHLNTSTLVMQHDP